MLDNRGRDPVFPCAACGESVTPDFRFKWLRTAVFLLALVACLAGMLTYPRWLVLWIALMLAATGFVFWSMPYLTPLKSAARPEP
jgi:hypothetical protein